MFASDCTFLNSGSAVTIVAFNSRANETANASKDTHAETMTIDSACATLAYRNITEVIMEDYHSTSIRDMQSEIGLRTT